MRQVIPLGGGVVISINPIPTPRKDGSIAEVKLLHAKAPIDLEQACRLRDSLNAAIATADQWDSCSGCGGAIEPTKACTWCSQPGPSLEPNDEGDICCPSCGDAVPACYWLTGGDVCRACERGL